MERKPSAMFCSVMNQLRLEGEFCDVVISVGGVEFSAHKNILCGCSPYFRALFKSSWDKKEKNCYKIPGIDVDMMHQIIEYAYTRVVAITSDNAQRLFIAADQFNIQGIIHLCTEFLIGQMCEENCLGLYKFTDHYYCPDLRQKAHKYILHNFKNIVSTSEEFLQMSPMELRDIIGSDELNVKDEETVFEAILKWIAYNPTERQQCISELLPQVRLALMPIEYFMNNVKSNNYVRNNDGCKNIIIEALKVIYDLNMNDDFTQPDFSNPFKRPRLPFTVLFATGGWSGGSPTNAIECYDSRANRWKNVTYDDESPRAYHGAAYLKGYLYLIGGFDSVAYFSSVKRFDPVKKIWQPAAPMHSIRCYVSVTVLDDHIYAMGGFDGHVRLNTAERYDPETNQWNIITPMNEQRSDASATVLHNKVYICGGFNGNDCLFTAEVFNPVTGQWTLIAHMGTRRSGCGVIAYKDKVYAIGGFDGSNRLRSGEAYSPATDTWRPILAMNTTRSNFGIEVVDDLLFVAGGFNGFNTTSNVEHYDEEKDEWQDAQEMEIHRSALSCCIIPGLSNIRDYVADRNSAPRLEAPSSSSDNDMQM
ncbi:kelch-like protein 10 [Hyperolius riggenbachi]|uniref:kelch-like protein 10 n=1 Tax=Hyperolius riggenbachi TaxID=752182 RepID=UPI0035A350AC